MSEDHQYDSVVARNISPERRSTNESSFSSTSESSEDEENSQTTLHRKKSDAAGFNFGKTR